MRWKPTIMKNDNMQSWVMGEKSWQYSNVYVDKWKVKNGKTDPDKFKIKLVRLR